MINKRTEHPQTSTAGTHRKREKAGRTALIGDGFMMLFTALIVLSAANIFAAENGLGLPKNVGSGLWRGNGVQFVVSQNGTKIVPGEELKEQPSDVPRSFIATVPFPADNPIGLKSIDTSILIPIEIQSDGRFINGEGTGTVVEGQFTSPFECSGTVTIVHTHPVTGTSVTGTLEWEAAPAGKYDIVEIKEALEAGLISLTFTGAQDDETIKIEAERILSVPMIVAINKGSESFPHRHGEIAIITDERILVDLTDKAQSSLIVSQAGKGRMRGTMSQRARFSEKTAELYSKLRYSKEAMLAELIAALRHENPWIRSGAATALGEIGDMRAVSELEKLFANDPDQDVRKAAKDALEKIRKPEESIKSNKTDAGGGK